MLVLPYMPDGFKVIITTSTIAVGTAFSSILINLIFLELS